MPSVIDEHTQFIDPSTGLPIVGGSLYIGSQNQYPVANTITIYSDRGLTTTISNPQTLDASGRATNKIWVPGKYSLQVNDSGGVQKYQELDCGELAQTGISLLDNVQGTNTITAEGSPAVLTLVDKQIYIFTAAVTNTGAVTLQIDTTAAKSVKKAHDQNLVAGDIEADQVVAVAYNLTDDVYEMVSSANSGNFDVLSVSGAITGASFAIGSDNIYPAISETPTATTSGAEHEYTGLPSTITQLAVTLAGVSSDGTVRTRFQLGDATTAGYITTGYDTSVARTRDGLNPIVNSPTTGIFIDESTTAGRTYSGSLTVTLHDPTNFIYVFHGMFSDTGSAVTTIAGTITLAGLMDRIKITTSTDAFDAGSINIRYQ